MRAVGFFTLLGEAALFSFLETVALTFAFAGALLAVLLPGGFDLTTLLATGLVAFGAATLLVVDVGVADLTLLVFSVTVFVCAVGIKILLV